MNPRLRLLPALTLALALLCAQALGLWHGTAHALPAPQAFAAFDDHDAGDAGCRLFDQLLHADGLPVAAPWLADCGAASAPAAMALQAARLAPAWRQRARGPPRA